MANVITEFDTFDSILGLVREARRYVVIVSPYINKDSLCRLINERSDQNVLMLIFCLSPFDHRLLCKEDQEALDEYIRIVRRKKFNKNFQIHVCYGNSVDPFYDSLDVFHCKCFFNEQRFLLTSMNLSSRMDRCELGVVYDRNKEAEMYDLLLNWFIDQFCKKVGVVIDKGYLLHPPTFGACIRCGCNIPLDLRHPYCKECEIEWFNYGGWSGYKEKYCHVCGKEYQATRNCPSHTKHGYM